jgi:hypothetical protein
MGIGLGPSNGTLPSTSQNQAVVPQLPQPNLQHHPLAYEQYPEVSSYDIVPPFPWSSTVHPLCDTNTWLQAVTNNEGNR